MEKCDMSMAEHEAQKVLNVFRRYPGFYHWCGQLSQADQDALLINLTEMLPTLEYKAHGFNWDEMDPYSGVTCLCGHWMPDQQSGEDHLRQHGFFSQMIK